MGEVYRARDGRLQRDVAIKVLPEAFAQDSDRLARFEREARSLAALNHQNIAAIYGLEDAGGVKALVMELVEGPTLADHIARGPVPIADALPIARQMSEALEAAHEQGGFHRDIKPANIKVRSDGTVKVLDFGLAKAGADPRGVAESLDVANHHVAGHDAGGHDPRDRSVHEPGASARARHRQAHRHLGVRLRALRNADGAKALRGRDRVGPHCRDSRSRTRLGAASRQCSAQRRDAVEAMSGQKHETSSA